MKKLLYSLNVIFSVFFIALSNPVDIEVNAQETAYEEYHIKKGDTLWDISNSNVQDPFLWPKLWKENPQIKNPDLIYPGDKIKIPLRETRMPTVEAPEEPSKKLIKETPVVSKPEIRKEKIPIEASREKTIEYIVNKELYSASGWISEEISGVGQIINAPTERTIFGSHDIVYLKMNEGVIVGDKFIALRKIKKVFHPETRKLLGSQIRVTGILKVIGMEDNMPKGQIMTAFEDIHIGDELIYYTGIEPPLVPDTIRTPDINGYIVESRMNLLNSGSGDIIYLDKGHDDGLKAGDMFSVFSSTPLKSPIGTIQVIFLKPTTSVAIILKSQKEITIGDEWGKNKIQNSKLSLQN